MPWTELVKGKWTKDAPVDRLDPYLLWADATLFVDYRFERLSAAPTETADKIPLLLKLKQPVSVAAIDRFLVRTRNKSRSRGESVAVSILPGSQFLTLRTGPWFFKLLRDWPWLRDLVQRVELCAAVRPEKHLIDTDVITNWLDVGVSRASSCVVLGVIDDGCPFAHANFRRVDDSTRFVGLWDQSDSPAFPSVAGRATRSYLNKFITRPYGAVDEEWCYEANNYLRVRRRATHGAHVLSVFAGLVPPRNRVPTWPTHPPTFQPEDSIAARSDLVFVQLPDDAVQDNSGKWLGVHVLDGLRFICAHVPAFGRAVVNVSYGPQTGPHDGTSLLEQAIDEAHGLMSIDKKGLLVTLPSGNAFNNRCHARFDVPAHSSRELSWQVPPDSEAAAFMEVWLPRGAPLGEVRVELEPPSGRADVGCVGNGDMRVWPDNMKPKAGMIFLSNVPQSDHRTMVLLAMAPTTTFAPDRPIAPAGRWKVRVCNHGTANLCGVSAQIASNGTDLSASRRGRQSHFVDDDFDPERYIREASDDECVRTSAVERRQFLSGIATGAKTQVLSGYRLSDGKFAKYSGAGPSDAPALTAPKNPSWASVTEESPGLPGLRAGGVRSGSTVRLVGTSVAAPQAARCAANQASVCPVPDPDFDIERGGAGLAPLP